MTARRDIVLTVLLISLAVPAWRVSAETVLTPFVGEKVADFHARVGKACEAPRACIPAAGTNGTIALAYPVEGTSTPFVGERATEFEQRSRKTFGQATAIRAPIVFDPSVIELHPNVHGQYHLDTIVEGSAVTMLLDTGASVVALSTEDAAKAGIQPMPDEFRSSVMTANGVVAAAPVRIREIRVGTIVARDVDAVVLPPGKLAQSLLGMSFLRRIDRLEIVYGRLRLSGP
jgi:aspartyl protease family protein